MSKPTWLIYNRNYNFIIWKVKLSNKSRTFRSIKINSNQTYGHLADQNKRGQLRGSFDKIFYPQLKNNIIKIFDGSIKDI